MFWDTIEDVKESVKSLDGMITGLACSVEEIQEDFRNYFRNEDEYSPINRINDKLNHLISDSNQVQKVMLAEKTMDKFEDYMKNIDKLNLLVNEFKGCVSLGRLSLQERKDMMRYTQETEHKIDAIFENMQKFAEFMQKCEKKSPKKRKSSKKKPRNNKKGAPITPASESVQE